MYYTRIQDKNHMIISIDTEKNIWQNSTLRKKQTNQQTKKHSN